MKSEAKKLREYMGQFIAVKVVGPCGKELGHVDPYVGMKVQDPTEPDDPTKTAVIRFLHMDITHVCASLGIENCPLLPLHALSTRPDLLEPDDWEQLRPVSTEFKDKAGIPLKEGNFIIYGHVAERSPNFRYGRILETRLRKKEASPGSDPTPGVLIIGIEEPPNGKPRPLARESWHSNLDRVLRVDEDQIPKAIFSLLRGYKRKTR